MRSFLLVLLTAVMGMGVFLYRAEIDPHLIFMVEKMDRWVSGPMETPEQLWNRHMDTCFALNREGEYSRAAESAAHALRVARIDFGENHEKTAFSLHALALCYFRKNNNEGAVPLFHQAAAILENTSGHSDSRTIHYRINLAEAYLCSGRENDAEAVYENVLKRLEGDGDEKVPEMIPVLTALGHRQLMKKEFDAANSFFGQAVDTASALGKGDSAATAALMGLGHAAMMKGDDKSAESFFYRALHALEKENGAMDTELVPVLFSLVRLYERTENHFEAVSSLNRIIRIKSEADDPDFQSIREDRKRLERLHAKRREIG